LISHRSRRPRTFLLLLAGAALVSLLVAAIASALPGDPPIANQAPADGATLPAVAEGLKVTFSCPAYRTAEEVVEIEEENEEEEIEIIEETISVFGGSEEYGVNFSTSPTPGTDGRLTTAGFGEAGEGESEAVKGTPNCTSELELPTVPNPAVLYSGRVYWQAFRECEGCASGYETGPVSSFVLFPKIEEGEINYVNHIFGGYLTKVHFSAEAELKGTKILLQRWGGSAWETIGEEEGSNAGENNFYVTLAPGHQLLRPFVVGTGVALALEPKARTVRKPKGSPPAPVATGTWIVAGKTEQEEFPLSFRVTDAGTMLRGLNAPIEAICHAATPAGNVTIEAVSAIHHARIAPDGSVVGRTRSNGEIPSIVALTGNFYNGRFTGELTSAFANCTGFRQFEAVLQKPPKK
jgi:hypothetical protein